jgi:hypothetical protein
MRPVLIHNQSHARQVLAAYQRLPPGANQQPITVPDVAPRRLRRTHILGGLINEHRYAA